MASRLQRAGAISWWMWVVASVAGCWSYPDLPVVRPSGDRSSYTFPPAAREVGAGVKLFVLHTGETRVPWGQFYEGNEGWVGLRAIFAMKTTGAYFWPPVLCFLLVHPTEGPVLIDTCTSPRQGEPGYYQGFAGNVHEDDLNRMTAEQHLDVQLRAHGVAPEDVRHVVLTHLHEDHVGELHRFGGAVVHLSREEHAHLDHRPFLAPLYYPPNFESTSRWDPVELTDGALGGFPAVKDLFGDGTVILLPTYGHTPGHLGVLVQLGDHLAYLTGDSLYTLRHLDPDGLAAFNPYDEEYQDGYRSSVRRIASLQRELVDLVVLPQHDPTRYTFDLMMPALADGRLDPGERSALLAYQARLYDAEGRLRPSARPRLVGEDEKGEALIEWSIP